MQLTTIKRNILSSQKGHGMHPSTSK